MANNESCLSNLISRMISVSDLSRGMASKVIQNIINDKNGYIVIKNNKPEAVIIFIDEYIELISYKDK